MCAFMLLLISDGPLSENYRKEEERREKRGTGDEGHGEAPFG